MQEVVSKRHRERKYHHKTPLSRKLAQLLERGTKALTFGLLGKLLRTKHLTAPLSLDKVNSILILRYDALGDMIISTPLWRTLKKLKPSITIGVAGSKRNIDLLRTDPDIDEVYEFSKQSSKHLLSELKRAKQQKWDVVINPVYAEKTRGAILSYLAAPQAYRATIVREKLSLYENIYSIVGVRPPLKPPTPMLEQIVQTLQAAVSVHFSKENCLPSLTIDPQIDIIVLHRLKELFCTTQTTRAIVINTETAEAFREWGLENSLQLSKELESRYADVLILWTASPNRTPILESKLSSSGLSRTHHFPTPTIQSLVALVRHSTLVISPDTSITHIASAEHKPLVCMYMEENEFLPFGITYKIHMPEPGKPMSTISVSDVLHSTIGLLDQ